MVDPVVRYMILCDDMGSAPNNPRRINIFGLLSTIRPQHDPPYPHIRPEFTVFVALTEGRGRGEGRISCVYEENGEEIFRSPTREIAFPDDPLQVVGLRFRVQECRFPRAGRYSVQFWYNDSRLEDRPLLLR